jgi:hypothetical protein
VSASARIANVAVGIIAREGVVTPPVLAKAANCTPLKAAQVLFAMAMRDEVVRVIKGHYTDPDGDVEELRERLENERAARAQALSDARQDRKRKLRDTGRCPECGQAVAPAPQRVRRSA